VVLFIYFQLRHPIRTIFEELPTLVSHSSKLSVGSVSLEIQNALSNAGDTALAYKLKGISESEFTTLLDLESGSHYWFGISDNKKEVWLPPPDTINAWLDLKRRGLVDLSVPPDEFEKVISSFKFSSQLASASVVQLPKPLTDEQVQKLRAQTVKVNDEGEKVVHAALRLFLNQLSNQGESKDKP
jgi:hypothetical protein